VPNQIDTPEVRDLAANGAQLVEVLPESAYAREHLPGAINIPMPDLDAKTAAQLDRERPVVVYCYDHECDLSARAAHLLEALGFLDVYDYVASKAAWLAHGLPVDGDVPAGTRAGAIARPVPTCSFEATIGDIADRFDGGEACCVVVDDAGVVLGVVGRDALHLPDTTGVEAVLQPAPPSVRPSITATELSESMQRDTRSYVLVTHPGGELIGVISRQDLYGQH
jgi:rhodanese-related sulfurtransferase/CBS domain-containing protein